jgi:hypothetical protein
MPELRFMSVAVHTVNACIPLTMVYLYCKPYSAPWLTIVHVAYQLITAGCQGIRQKGDMVGFGSSQACGLPEGNNCNMFLSNYVKYLAALVGRTQTVIKIKIGCQGIWGWVWLVQREPVGSKPFTQIWLNVINAMQICQATKI